jgi:hypothetical protein
MTLSEVLAFERLLGEAAERYGLRIEKELTFFGLWFLSFKWLPFVVIGEVRLSQSTSSYVVIGRWKFGWARMHHFKEYLRDHCDLSLVAGSFRGWHIR